MKIINIAQRTPEWHDFRKNGVGASESAAVLGLSKYKTPHNIWEGKTGRSFPQVVNEYMQHGIDTEDTALEAFININGNNFKPICAEHERYPFIKASFDGVSENKQSFVELKCPRSSKLIEKLDSQDVNLIRKEFPDYWCQVQHQHTVCGADVKGYLAAYKDGYLTFLEIPRDDEFIGNDLIPGITEFWHDYVLTDTPPPLDDKDYVYVDDPKVELKDQEWICMTELWRRWQLYRWKPYQND